MDRYIISVRRIHCIEEEDAPIAHGGDEPYVLVFTVDRRALLTAPDSAAWADTRLYGPWEDVDTDETKYTKAPGLNPLELVQRGIFATQARTPCWGLTQKPAPIADPDDVIVTVALMEDQDIISPELARSVLQDWMIVQLGIRFVSNPVLAQSRADFARAIREEMSAFITATHAIPGIGFVSLSTSIGVPREYRLTNADLGAAVGGPPFAVERKLNFAGPSGNYDVYMQLAGKPERLQAREIMSGCGGQPGTVHLKGRAGSVRDELEHAIQLCQA